jgi:hypothetical protein
LVVVAMVADHYPGLERFFLPASAIACVLAGAGFARVGVLAAGALKPRRGPGGGTTGGVGADARGGIGGGAGADARGGPGRRGVAVGVAVALLGVSVAVPIVRTRISGARSVPGTADLAVSTLDQLSDAVKAVGGKSKVLPCKTSGVAINHSVQTALAWKLDTDMTRVGTSLRAPGVLFVGPWNSVDGGPAPVDPRLTHKQLLAHVGVWKVYRLTDPRPGIPTHCAGT